VSQVNRAGTNFTHHNEFKKQGVVSTGRKGGAWHFSSWEGECGILPRPKGVRRPKTGASGFSWGWGWLMVEQVVLWGGCGTYEFDGRVFVGQGQ
jgi:hypothetical protein